MGFISDILGTNDKYHASSANLLKPTTVAQANTAQDEVQQGLGHQQDFVNALQGQNGIQNQSNVFNQVQGVANGTGPNPAQAMLANATGNNIASQAALMASQRGVGANPGLIGRQAALQGGNIQQQAAGQGAALQAQQSLGALNQLGGIANQQVSNQGNAISGYNQFAQGNQGQVLNSIANQNANEMGIQGINAGVSAANANRNAAVVGGVAQAGGAAIGMAEGGQVAGHGPKSLVGKHFHMMAKGGSVPVMLSPGEKYLSPEEAQKVASQEESVKQVGKKIPGKAKVEGDSLKNDVVPAKLEEGGFVIPRSVMESKNPSAAAANFVRKHLESQAKKSKS